MIVVVLAVLWVFASAHEVATDDCRPIGMTGFQSRFCEAGPPRELPRWVLEP